MLKGAAGIVVIPKDPNIEMFEFSGGNGKVMTFDAISFEPKKSGQPQEHRLRYNMFLKMDEVQTWKEKIQSGKFFMLTCVEIASYYTENMKFPAAILRIRPWNITQLKTPVEQV